MTNIWCYEVSGVNSRLSSVLFSPCHKSFFYLNHMVYYVRFGLQCKTYTGASLIYSSLFESQATNAGSIGSKRTRSVIHNSRVGCDRKKTQNAIKNSAFRFI